MISRLGLLTYGFVALSLASTGPLVWYSMNYMQFFPALAQLELHLGSTRVDINQDHVTLYAEFVLSNPTGYSGLAVRSIEPVVKVQGANGTLFIPSRGIFVAEKQPPTPLGPRSDQVVSVSHSFSPSDAQLFMGISDMESIIFHFDASVHLSTLLDKISKITFIYECESPGEQAALPVRCIQSSGEAVGVDPFMGGGGV